MVTAELSFRVVRRVDDEAIGDAVDRLVEALQRNGQVLSEGWPIAREGRRVRAYVSIPEPGALHARRKSRWVSAARLGLRQAGLRLTRVTNLGSEPVALDVCRHEAPSSYILYTTGTSMESPLRCGECFDPVPLYRIPHTDECGTYEDIIFWRRNYQRFDGIWFASRAGERFAYRCLSRFDSELSAAGREVCERIRKLTGKRVYYYLYRHYGRSRNSERRRHCPSCQGEWLLDEPWHGCFDFRCDRCCLVSNIVHDVR